MAVTFRRMIRRELLYKKRRNKRGNEVFTSEYWRMANCMNLELSPKTELLSDYFGYEII